MLKRFLLICCLLSPWLLSLGQETIPNSDFMQDYRRSYFSEELGIDIPARFNVTLYDTIVSWLGTPYRFAGNCEKGIDCSGFVTVLYDRALGLKLGARNAAEIYNLMEKIDPSEMKEGDLVFFSIHKRRISHIGVYLSNNKFVHSSTSRGVIISDLNEPYYKRYFAGAGHQKPITVNNLTQAKDE